MTFFDMNLYFQCVELGRIISIESNHKPLEVARKGAEVCIKIEAVSGEAPKMFGRHFDENDLLMSKVETELIFDTNHQKLFIDLYFF